MYILKRNTEAMPTTATIAPPDTTELLFLHNFIMQRILGRPLHPNELVVHLDGNGFNCRDANLKLITTAEQHLYSPTPKGGKYAVTDQKHA